MPFSSTTSSLFFTVNILIRRSDPITPSETPVKINEEIATGDVLEIDLDNNKLKNLTANKEYALNPLGDIKAIMEAGDVFKYAKQMGE